MLTLPITTNGKKLDNPCPFDRHPVTNHLGFKTMVGSINCKNCTDHISYSEKAVICNCKFNPIIVKNDCSKNANKGHFLLPV
jgi:hypothetical protein